jgi:hypothetical protein
MHRSHSRRTQPFDKIVSVKVEHPNRSERMTSVQSQTTKKLQKRKQRQYDKKISRVE